MNSMRLVLRVPLGGLQIARSGAPNKAVYSSLTNVAWSGTGWPVWCLIALALLQMVAWTANATNWYVDSTATGSNKGTNWANAWTSISSISGVSAGDTVYISGGPSGSSQTYSVSSWHPVGGSAASPITYQIGQDLNHNGTAIFTGSGNWIVGPLVNVVVSGDAGDGARHFSIANPANNVSPYGEAVNYPGGPVLNTNWRIAYVNFGKIGAAFDIWYNASLEIDHTYAFINNMNADHWGTFNTAQGTTTWDQIKFHDNIIILPRTSAAAGADGIQSTGTGISVYNNTIGGYITSYTGGQHQDGFQPLAGAYIKVYNNVITNIGNCAIYIDSFGSIGFNHVQIINNIIVMPIGSGCYGIQLYEEVPSSMNDVLMANNLVVGGGAYGFAYQTQNGSSGGGLLITSSVFQNNITTGNGYFAFNIADSSTDTIGHNVVAPANDFTSDYHLAASATDLRNQGANLYAYFTTDKDGTIRPAIGAWDIGPYQYGGGPSTNGCIVVYPANLNPLVVSSNSTTNVNFTVSNACGGFVAGTAYVLPANSPFQVVSGGTYNLGTNASQTVTVRFNPSVVGATNATIYFPGGGGATVSVTGIAFTALTNLRNNVPTASFNSTAGIISAPFAVTGNYISQAVGTGLTGSGEAIYGFSVDTAGSYVVAAQVNAPSTAANSFFLNIDGEPTDPTMIWDVPVTTNGFTLQSASWRGTGTDTNAQFVPEIFNLSAGTHYLVVRGREAGAQLGAITISISPPLYPHLAAGF